MRRHKYPYNGSRYVLNMSTGEVHDLDHETDNCKIDLIHSDNVYNCDSYQQAAVHQALKRANCNGCYYCLREKDNG